MKFKKVFRHESWKDRCFEFALYCLGMPERYIKTAKYLKGVEIKEGRGLHIFDCLKVFEFLSGKRYRMGGLGKYTYEGLPRMKIKDILKKRFIEKGIILTDGHAIAVKDNCIFDEYDRREEKAFMVLEFPSKERQEREELCC